MQQESLAGKPEREQPRHLQGNPKPKPETFTGQPIKQATDTQDLMTQAASIARHPLGRGLPADHEALQ